MAQKIEVVKLMINEETVEVVINNTDFLTNKKIIPEGRMLADSDSLAFVYLLNVDDEFVYLSFPETVWKELHTAYQKKLPIVLQMNENDCITLTDFHEELSYFICNIEENSNYGVKMVSAVTAIFL